jgi:hypothetical protein
MLYISIVFTLFALLGGMHLLAKTKKEMLGNFFTWISYLIIVVSLALLVCQSTRAVMRMTCCRNSCSSSESCCMPGMMHHCGMMRHCEMGQGKCCDEMKECKMKNDSGCCDKMKHGKCADMDEEKEEKADSTKK